MGSPFVVEIPRSEYLRGEGVRGGVWGDRVVVDESGWGVVVVTIVCKEEEGNEAVMIINGGGTGGERGGESGEPCWDRF